MEHETEIQASKFSKISNNNNGKLDTSKIGKGEHRNRGSSSSSTTAITIAAMGEVGGGNRLRDWQHSSRIIRVSRASGGKDRHSKVWTAKGPRDRRVRLSVATAIQFYDLQDRLGVDQPSKAVEWLIKAASEAISELPSLNSSFDHDNEAPTPTQQLICNGNGDGNGDDEQVFDSSAELELDLDRGDPGFLQGKSSACSSTSETSKGSGRTEIRAKARERARERTAKDRDKPGESALQQQQSSSFTQLLTSGIGNMNNPGVSSSSSPMNNYSGVNTHHSSAQIIQLGNHHMMQHHHQHQQQSMMTVSPFSLGGEHELQHFPFVPDLHLIAAAPTGAGGGNGGGGGDHHYNLNFSISPSSALAAFNNNNNNRGTLQSNSLPTLLPHFQRFPSSTMDGSTLPFFLGAPIENQQHHNHQHQHHSNAGQYPSGLQLCYGDNGGGGVSDQKGKGKN